MKNCEMCKNEHNGTYGSGRFCSIKCSKGFSTKNKRIEINEKISTALTGKGNNSIIKKCNNCKKEFTISYKKRKQVFCSIKCKASCATIETKNKISKKLKKWYQNDSNRERLKNIGRKGGFGKKGYTSNGVYYQSIFEKKVFEYLDNLKIEYEPHKKIPNSTKISDLYLIEKDLWIELDGINREKKKEWLGKDYEYWLEKLKIYNREKLNYKIIYTFQDFLKIIL